MAEKDQKKPEQDSNAPEFAIQRVYVKDLSLECPSSPGIFLDQWEPELNMDLGTDAKNILSEGVREVVLTVSVTVKVKEKTAFLVEVKQAGIFTLNRFPDEQLKHLLGSFCPSILYPYAREVVTDAVVRAGFPQLYLTPVNFDALYEQHQKEEKDKGDKAH
ncbi:MAG: protein-export chaperone SecB [Gammaproteobacteria bacterium]|nr:protein-export chaperone SecB [Gammaproteobacteria bacterium]